MAFYGSLLATGQVSIEILPQFAVSAIFFLFFLLPWLRRHEDEQKRR